MNFIITFSASALFENFGCSSTFLTPERINQSFQKIRYEPGKGGEMSRVSDESLNIETKID
jgi:hypothetical protein